MRLNDCSTSCWLLALCLLVLGHGSGALSSELPPSAVTDEITEVEPELPPSSVDNEIKGVEASAETESFIEMLGERMKKSIEPVTSYTKLVTRYKSWFEKYGAIEQASAGALQTRIELFKEEYGKADAELALQECSIKSRDTKSLDKRLPANLDSVDFVFRVLSKTVDGLESRLAKVEAEQPTLHEEDLFYDAPDHLEDPAQFEAALERLKRISSRMAKALVASELQRLAQVTAFNVMANVAKKYEVESLGPIANILAVLGSANTPIAVAYLRSVRTHVVFTVLSRFNPASYVRC